MIKPPKLNIGDTVGLVATSSLVPKERITPSIKVIENLGLNVVVGDSCYSDYGYLAGSDETRSNDINKMFSDKQIKGIFVIRGGYGAARLLDKLDYHTIKNNPKIFAGYSDVTALHLAFNQMCNLITYHSPMPATELYKSVDSYTMESFTKAIFTDSHICNIVNPTNNALITLVNGEASGQLIGGNLTLICSSLGTKYEVNTKNKILFLEEVDEAPYRIDRMLLQLAQAGKIEDANGIIFGGFTDCIAEDPNKSLTINQILDDIVKPFRKPTILNLSCGHLLPTLTLPMGANLYMNTKKGEILFLK